MNSTHIHHSALKLAQASMLEFEPNGGMTPLTRSLTYLLAFLALWRSLVVFRMHTRRPRNLPIKYQYFAIGKLFFNFDFILEAPSRIFRGYHDLEKISFALPTLTEYQVLACSDQDVKAVCESSERTLSFHAAMTDRLKHKYTMFGFEHNDVDPHNAVPARTLRILLKKHLPALRPIIEARVREGFEKELCKISKDSNGWSSVSAFGLSKRITERVNSQIFLGTELANASDFMISAIRYSHDAIVAAEICRQLPSILTPIVAPAIMRWSGAMKAVAASIKKVVEQKLHEIDSESSSIPEHTEMDCLQWVIESSRTKAQKTIDRLVQQVGAVFFAAAHQMPMALVYALYSMCDHPEYVELLRSEAKQYMDSDIGDSFKHMHLLDAFLRESARLNPLDALSIQRKVLEPLSLPSGGLIPDGNLIAVPQQAILRNSDLYPNPECFNAYRYFPVSVQAHPERAQMKTQFTDVSRAYSYWGSTRKPCPGRWYVSETLKVALVHLLMNYDFKLEDEEASRSFFWTTAIVPRLRTKIVMRKRETSE